MYRSEMSMPRSLSAYSLELVRMEKYFGFSQINRASIDLADSSVFLRSVPLRACCFVFWRPIGVPLRSLPIIFRRSVGVPLSPLLVIFRQSFRVIVKGGRADEI